MAEQRLIEAEALYKKVLESHVTNIDGYSYINHNRVLKMIDNEPTVEAKPVVHGRWVEKEKYTFGIMYDCSLCENRILDNGHPWNYCPNCGAKMDESEDKNEIF